MSSIRIPMISLILSFFPLILYSQNIPDNILERQISVSCTNMPMEEVLQQISQKSGVSFSYSSDIVSFPKRVTIHIQDKPIKFILNQLLSGTSLGYKVIGNQIIFQPVNKSSQKHTISGFIREEGSAELLPGANIYAPSLKVGTVSNTYGFYSLTLSELDSLELIFSYVGYTPVIKKISLTSDQEININLKPGTLLKDITVYADANIRR